MSVSTPRVFCGTDGLFCSVGCQVRGEHRDYALTVPWVIVPTPAPAAIVIPADASDDDASQLLALWHALARPEALAISPVPS